MDKFNRFFDPLWLWLHNGHVIRRVVLFFAIWMTYDSYQWAKLYAISTDPNEFIYAAVLSVPSAMLAASIKFYNTGREK